MTLGGRAAEELVFHEATTGAANDLEKVTATSKAMIMRYGMSEKLGPRVLGATTASPSSAATWATSPTTPTRSPARSTTRSAASSRRRTRPLRVLREHMDELHQLSGILIERETIDRDQFERLLAGEAEESVFPEEVPEPAEARRGPPKGPAPKPKPRPVPGRLDAAAQARIAPRASSLAYGARSLDIR